MDIQITDEQKVLVTLAPKTQSGKDATLDGDASFTVESGDATVEPQPGGLSAYIVSGAQGPSSIKVSADADLGEGVRTIEDTINLTVVGAEATNLGLVVGSPEPK